MPLHNFEGLRGRVVEIEIDSAALRGNMLGDPSKRRVAVHLPPGYDEGDRHYPLFVYLAGFTGSGLRGLAWTAYGESVPQRLERLLVQGAMGPVVSLNPWPSASRAMPSGAGCPSTRSEAGDNRKEPGKRSMIVMESLATSPLRFLSVRR